ncbi:hypothetical protein [Methylobacterium sp. J-068]|uniref:hypothetical protein n=1 Tax=Methylobacterium sp. J-068 TaxID=2836649 RepID=UPI001FB88C4C|nr:hypothetical protein [Methylobacterium sp. J-068]MCJ2034512.1 hypothetical protein [Methylobacterium sp. J-068]
MPAALIFRAPQRVAWSIIDGRVVVREGRLTTLDTRALVARHPEGSNRSETRPR